MTNSHHCRDCRKFLGQGELCSRTEGLNGDVCEMFEPGKPFAPSFQGVPITEFEFDPTQPAAWSFWISSDQVMMIAWELDRDQYGHFRCFLMQITDDGIKQKQFTPTTSAPAFAGEVVVKGTNQNDLWNSFGFEDEDEFDLEGNLINKPREVKIYPARED